MAVTLLSSNQDLDKIGQENCQKIAQSITQFFVLENQTLEVEVSLIGLEDIREINMLYRQINEPTDVLSFPTFNSLQEIQAAPPSVPILIGSVLICPDKATAYEETLEQLLVHGLLHILGFDHEKDMLEWRKIEEGVLHLLKESGLTIAGIPYESL